MSAGFHFDGSGTEGSVEKEARIKSSFKSLEIDLSIESGHGSSFLFSISLVSVLRLGFLYTTNAFILAIIFVFFFEDNLIFSITCVLYIYIRISIILESFFCYVSVIRPQGYYITFNFDTFFSRIFLLQKFSKAKFNHRK